MNLQEALDQSVSPVSFHDAEGRPLGTGEYATARDVVAEAQRLRACVIAVMTGHGMHYHYFDGTGQPVPIGEGVFSVPDELYARLQAHLPTLVRETLDRPLPLEAARPVQEQYNLRYRLEGGLSKLHEVQGLLQTVVGSMPSASQSRFQAAIELVGRAAGAMNQGLASGVWEAAHPRDLGEVTYTQQSGVVNGIVGQLVQMRAQLDGVIRSVSPDTLKGALSDQDIALASVSQALKTLAYDMGRGGWEAARPVNAARPRGEQMLCDNASRKGSGRGISLSPQCYDSPATQSVTLDQDGEIENFDLCDACTKALRRSARQHGYHVTTTRL